MNIRPRALHFLALFALVALCSPSSADWKIGTSPDSNEVRLWASPKEAGLDFYWSGKVNAQHEGEGYGILEWFKMEKFKRNLSLVYTGELKAGRRHGFGVSLQKSGAKYSGEWRDNLKEGKGEYWYSNGDYYSGMFHNDLMHGTGRYLFADGTAFEGSFAADERNGPGSVTYADGRSYTSTWLAGKDTNPLGPPTPAKPYATLGVDVSRYALDGKILSGDDGVGPEFYLTYRGRWTDGLFIIQPDWPYWVAWSKGGPVITADDSSGNFNTGTFPVFLDLRVNNPGREKLEVRRAEVMVDESFPDLEPILRIQDASGYGGVTCEIVNFNLSRVDSCELAFNILPLDATPTFEKYQFLEKIEPFSSRAQFSLARAMDALGMDAGAIAAIEKTDEDRPAREVVEQRVRRELGKFSKFIRSSEGDNFIAYALIAGELRIGWTDHAGVAQTKRVKFQFRKCFAQFGAEMSVEAPSSGKYDVILQTSAKSYLIPFAYKRTVAPGGNDRFTLQLASEASTYHSFRIRLTTSDGREISSPSCRLHFLVPRNFSWKEGHVTEDP